MTCRCGQNGKRLGACRHEIRYRNASVESMAASCVESLRMGSNNSPALGCWVTKFHKPARSATPHGPALTLCERIAAARAHFCRSTLHQPHSRRQEVPPRPKAADPGTRCAANPLRRQPAIQRSQASSNPLPQRTAEGRTHPHPRGKPIRRSLRFLMAIRMAL
jgi:hypothetical protein